jgi:transposase-like protein
VHICNSHSQKTQPPDAVKKQRGKEIVLINKETLLHFFYIDEPTSFQNKPSKFTAGYRKYNPESMLLAYKAVKEKGLQVEKAARQFGVPSQTLRDRVRGAIDPVNFACGGSTLLTLEEEQTLVEHIETMAQLEYGVTNKRLQHLGGDLAFELGRKQKNTPMSNNWLYGFLLP